MTEPSYRSVVEMLRSRIRSTPDARAILHRTGAGWGHLTWREVGRRVRVQACGLKAMGVGDADRIAILSSTRPEWVLADMAILTAGAATTTIYPSNTAAECAYILNDSNTVVLFAENEELARKVLSMRAQIPELRRIVLFGGQVPGEDFVVSLEDLERSGAEWDRTHPGEIDRIGDAVGPDWVATLIYTSGTTGKPKGVILTHDAWVYEGEGMEGTEILESSDIQYLFLPLAHSFAKVLEIAFIHLGIPTVVDGDIDTLIDNLSSSRPTFMGAVPRIFEKVYNKAVANAREGGRLQWTVFQWALDVGRQVSVLRQRGQEPTGLLAARYRVADRLVFSKLRARFGGRIRFFVSGGAPLSREIAEFFHAAGLVVLEGYGLTETSAASFVNRMSRFKFGTVGPPLPGTQVRIDTDGEILIRGRGVMRSYHGLPEETAAMFTEDGFLRTGDVGRLDEDGFLSITDRKKDIIVTAGGKNVAPQNIENLLRARCPFVSQVVVHGDRRNFCTAILTIQEEATARWAREHGVPFTDYASLAARPEVRALVQQCVDAVNRELASYESIKKFAILDRDFSQENGELTPKMNIRRREVEQRHRDLLDSFYTGTIERL